MKKLIHSLLITLLMVGPAYADNNSLFYQHGKIYVVVGVLSIIFLGLSFYLIRLDMRLSKMEKNKNKINP